MTWSDKTRGNGEGQADGDRGRGEGRAREGGREGVRQMGGLREGKGGRGGFGGWGGALFNCVEHQLE